jgi:hypothetical protein
MDCKSKSTQVFQVRLWSKKYYKRVGTPRQYNTFDGTIIDEKTKKKVHFHTAGQFLTAMENMYKEDERVV